MNVLNGYRVLTVLPASPLAHLSVSYWQTMRNAFWIVMGYD